MSINGRSAESAATGEFVAGEAELREFVAARVWALEEGPRALFDRAVLWLIEQRVLLPGIMVLARLVAEMRAAEHARIHALLANALTAVQLDGFDRLLIVPEGARTSELDQLRGGTVSMSGRGFQGALERAFAIEALGAGRVELPDVPPAKVAALARYGLSAKAPALRELSPKRRAAALLATVRQLEIDSVDDALDLFDLVMATKLLARAERQSDKAKLRSLPALRRAAAKVARALGVLLEMPEDGGAEAVSLAQAWARIERTVSRGELTVALEELDKLIPDDGDGDNDAEWRAEPIKRYGTVTGFLRLLARLELGAVGARTPVLAALRSLPALVHRKKVFSNELDATLITGSWRRLVFGNPELPAGVADHRAYTFCVLEQLHRGLRHREVYARPARDLRQNRRSRLLPAHLRRDHPDGRSRPVGLRRAARGGGEHRSHAGRQPGRQDAHAAGGSGTWTPRISGLRRCAPSTRD